MIYLISVFLGLIPEVLYFSLALIYTKNIKKKRIKLFLLIAIAYTLCIMIIKYELLFYVLFIFILYFILKILYKDETQIIDIFVITYFSFYLTLLSFLICFYYKYGSTLEMYIILYIINRILLFSIFIFRHKFNKLYMNYKKYWNRNDNIKKPIKSITLRNISLIAINCIVFFMNIICLYIMTKAR